jgi:PH (Pleckstrin Homology) domain-containing protein
MLPQYYEVRPDGLFIRQGWRRMLIPYDSLVDLQSNTDFGGAAVFSSYRLLVATRAGRRFIIAPVEQDRFLQEVARRAPHLECKPFGLGFTFSPRAFR